MTMMMTREVCSYSVNKFVSIMANISSKWEYQGITQKANIIRLKSLSVGRETYEERILCHTCNVVLNEAVQVTDITKSHA